MPRAYAGRRDSVATEPWTDARENDARRLWFAGKSATEIAKVLGGTSRSAILGLARRRGWNRTLGETLVVVAPVKPRLVQVRVEPRPPRVVTVAPPIVAGILTHHLSRTMCKFVVDPTRYAQQHCGAPVRAEGEPYCAHHRAICWTGLGVKVSERGMV